MGLIKYEGREYNFTWERIALFAICTPLFTVLFFYGFDWIWLHEITAKLTIWSLNLISGGNDEWFFTNDTIPPIEPWRLRIYLRETGQALPQITFTKMCTGIHAILMFIFVTLFTPQSTIKETNKDIWQRKIKAIVITSLLFYVVNILRMWLQLYLYSIGYEWEDIHYSISAASSFIAIAAILIIHKFVPEFIISLLWIGDEIKVKIRGKNPQDLSSLEQEKDEEDNNAEEETTTIKDDHDKLDDEPETFNVPVESQNIEEHHNGKTQN